MASTDPVPPFGAELAGVLPLVPEARAPEALGPGDRGVTAGQVRAWIVSLSSRVDVRLSGWRGLRAQATADETAAGEPAPLDRLKTAAADLVHNGAASYLEAARFPERAGLAETSYAAVLWARFTTGLDELATWLATTLEDETPAGDTVVDVTAVGGIGYSFPAPSFTPDAMRW